MNELPKHKMHHIGRKTEEVMGKIWVLLVFVVPLYSKLNADNV